MDGLFKGRHFDQEIIVLCMRWYLRYKLSFRDLAEMMSERGLLPGAYDDHALDPELCAGVREALEPLRSPSWAILAASAVVRPKPTARTEAPSARRASSASKLISAGFVKEVKAKASDPIWRRDEESGASYALNRRVGGSHHRTCILSKRGLRQRGKGPS
jgi:hypothetical protein